MRSCCYKPITIAWNLLLPFTCNLVRPTLKEFHRVTDCLSLLGGKICKTLLLPSCPYPFSLSNLQLLLLVCWSCTINRFQPPLSSLVNQNPKQLGRGQTEVFEKGKWIYRRVSSQGRIKLGEGWHDLNSSDSCVAMSCNPRRFLKMPLLFSFHSIGLCSSPYPGECAGITASIFFPKKI